MYVENLLVLQLLVASHWTFGANSYAYSSGPLPRTPCNNHKTRHGTSNNDNFQEFSKECVDDAFRELKEEFNANRSGRGTGKQQLDWVSAMMGSPDPQDDAFQTVDAETAKKWIEKAFDLAFEFNQDFTVTLDEKEATDQILQKTRDWIDKLYEDKQEAAETANDHHDGENSSSSQQFDTHVFPEKESEYRESVSHPTSKSPDEIVTKTPYSEDKSTEDIFRVSIDLPGVDQNHVDITVEDSILLLRAKRDLEKSDGAAALLYTKKFDLSENELDTNKLEASLKNGVLVIIAPKQKQKERKRKIPVS